MGYPVMHESKGKGRAAASRPPRLVITAVVMLATMVVAAQSVLADPLDTVLANLAQPGESQVLDDRALAEIRGRGTEGMDPSATGAGDLAVILWDEQAGNPNRNQRGMDFSYSAGQGNAQATSLVMQRY